MDTELKLVDTPEMTVEESEENLVLTFIEKMVFEPGETITVWSSEIARKARIEEIKQGLEDISEHTEEDMNTPADNCLKLLVAKFEARIKKLKGGE